MEKKTVETIINKLRDKYPDSDCTLEYDGDPWKLLIMGILSAQCKDERVNIVCKDLFFKYNDCFSLGSADSIDVENIIKPCGLYKVKSKNIIGSSKIISETFNGVVPSDMNQLLTLPGVGRKIANLMLGDCFSQPSIVTDTHCIRICGRLGFYDEKNKNPFQIEKILTKCIPLNERSSFCHRIVDFGREVCSAKNPKCENCILSEICKHNKGKR